MFARSLIKCKCAPMLPMADAQRFNDIAPLLVAQRQGGILNSRQAQDQNPLRHSIPTNFIINVFGPRQTGGASDLGHIAMPVWPWPLRNDKIWRKFKMTHAWIFEMI